jgi:MFS family permease
MNKRSPITDFPFFYGYVILISGTIGAMLSAPGQTVGISVFTDFLIKDLGITRGELSLAYMIGTLFSSFFLTYAGKFFDKYGARITSIAAGLFLGLSLIFLSKMIVVNNLISRLDLWINKDILIFLILSIGFFFVRFFGQGTLTMSSKNMIMKWFDARRGMASAVMGIAISFGFSYSPKIFDDLIFKYGWQNTWEFTGIFLSTIFVLFAFLTFRDNPQEYNLLPDGVKIAKKVKKTRFKTIKDFNLNEARRTYNFWIFNLTLSLQALYITAITFNIVDIFTRAGLNREDAILIFLPVSVIAVVFQLAGGFRADFIRLKYLLILKLIGMAMSMAGLAFLSEGLPLYLIILGNGIAGGLFGVLSVIAWPRFYGVKFLGEISGFSMSWIVAGSALGPYIFSQLFNIGESYFSSGLIMLFLCSVLLFLSLKVKNDNISE